MIHWAFSRQSREIVLLIEFVENHRKDYFLIQWIVFEHREMLSRHSQPLHNDFVKQKSIFFHNSLWHQKIESQFEALLMKNRSLIGHSNRGGRDSLKNSKLFSDEWREFSAEIFVVKKEMTWIIIIGSPLTALSENVEIKCWDFLKMLSRAFVIVSWNRKPVKLLCHS